MSITISFSFADAAAAAEFLALTAEVTNPLPEAPAVEVKAPPAKKPAKTEAPAPTPPTVIEEVKAPEPVAQEPTVLEYAPLAERITKLIGASNPERAENRQAIKDFFGECAASYGAPVKSGQDVRVEDRPLLAGLLKSLESANA